MKKLKIKEGLTRLSFLLLIGASFVGCVDEIDNCYSRNSYTLEMKSSTQTIKLDENTPDDMALSLEWSPAANLGKEYITTYTYEVELVGSTENNAIKEYVDNEFKRSYTHKDLQDLLVTRWKQLTSTSASVKFTVTASTEGPKLVIPEVSTVTIRIKTYGPIQFAADKLFISGSAAGENEIEIKRSPNNAKLFVYTGQLSSGILNFPVVYGDDTKENAICPKAPQEDITDKAMEATIANRANAGVWKIKDAGKYRVTVDFGEQTVTIIPAGDILDIDKLYLAGSAVGSETEILRTLEDETIFAFKGELSTGKLYLPIFFEEAKALSIVPTVATDHDVADGVAMDFTSAQTSTAPNRYWDIQTAGTYRIVVNTETRKITIYSAATDLKSRSVSWNNTVAGINPYTADITDLWIYGGFNSWKGDGQGFQGFDNKYKLVQSLADPNVFVYKGETLPRNTNADEYSKLNYTGAVRFSVSNIHNNVYAFGSTAEAKRNVKNGYITVTDNSVQTLVDGQGDNRYAYFCMPANTNYVMVNVQTLKVVFDSK